MMSYLMSVLGELLQCYKHELTSKFSYMIKETTDSF